MPDCPQYGKMRVSIARGTAVSVVGTNDFARRESVINMLGEHFRMSRRMHPSGPERFRLSYDPLSEFYVDSVDGSYWQACTLFDFGWGSEPGYYRYPLPETADLVELLLTAQAEDDYFGAASVLLEGNADEVLPQLEAALQNTKRYPLAAQRLAAVGLNRAVNHSEITGKSAEQVQADFAHWQALADEIVRMTEKQKTSWWRTLFSKKR
ncbi:MAG: hypothetical protein PHW41_01045 [Eubacteriales bacterium]|nr:hypothetical protein [Eubacteriales bacterium]